MYMLSRLSASSARRLAMALAALTFFSATLIFIYPHIVFRLALIIFSLILLVFVSYAEWNRSADSESSWGVLAKEASSDVVQAELASMRGAAWNSMNEVTAQTGIDSILKEVEKEFSGIDAGRDTPPSVLNTIISLYPRTPELKG